MYQILQEGEVLSYSLEVKYGELAIIIQWMEELRIVNILIVYPFQTKSSKHLDKVAELILRATNRRRLGSFYMDPDTGDIGFRIYMTGYQSQITKGQFASILFNGINWTEHYYLAIQSMVEQGGDPSSVVEEREATPLDFLIRLGKRMESQE